MLAPALEAAGHELVDELEGADAMVDFTAPEAALGNVQAAIAAGVPSVVGTSGWDTDAVRDAPVAVFYAPNFAIGAVLMMRFAEEAARHLPSAEIVELHHETKLDAPSGTAKATAERLPGEPPVHSVRLPGLVAHQEVLLGGARAASDHPPRRALPRGVRPGRPARPRAPALAPAGADRRPRDTAW